MRKQERWMCWPLEVYRDGKRYMANKVTSYPLPKDEGEMIRLNFQHRLVRAARGNHPYSAPLHHPARILDIGCGSGIWAHDLARLDRFQRTLFTNADIDPGMAARYTAHLAERGIRHPHVTFQQMNALERFPWQDNSFDFVHARFLTGAVPVECWPEVIKEMVRVTKPGGWVEVVEGFVEGDGPCYARVKRLALQLVTRMGPIDTTYLRLVGWIQDAGLMKCQEQLLEIGRGKLARFAGEVGEDVLQGIANSRGVYVRMGLLTEAAADALLAELRVELTITPLLLPIAIAWGQKPKTPR